MTIQDFVIGLIRIAHQAVIARGLAALAGPRGVIAVVSILRIEMAEHERLARDPPQRVGVVYEAPEDARPAL